MTTLADLHSAVQVTLASKRLGQPVFVRYHVNGLLDKDGAGILPSMARLAAVVGDWMGMPPDRLYSLPTYAEPGKGQETLTLLFPNGATAVVSCARGQPRGDGVDLTVIGSRGALYHPYEAGNLFHWEDGKLALGERRVGDILAAIENTREKGTNPAKVGNIAPKDDPPKPPPERGEPKARYGVLLVTGGQTHQENYAAAFAADKRCTVIAVTDEPDVDARRREWNERLARALGVPYEPDLGKALARKDVDVVSVCAPPDRRGRIIVKCAAAGKHLYLDKSLAPRLDEADAIVAAVKKAGVRSHMFTFVPQPWAREAKRLLGDGRMGKLLAIHADCFFAKGRNGTARLGTPRKEEYPPQRHQLAEAKRELDNVGVYPITLIRWLTGKPFRTIFGVTANYFFAEHQKHNVEDFGLLSCKLEDGLPVTIAAGRYGWTSHPAGGVNRLVLVGTERTLVIDANRPRLEASTDETPWVPPNVNPADPMGFWQSTQDEVHVRPKKAWVNLGPPAASDPAYFLDCLDAGKDSEVSAVEAAHATEVLLAGYRSASSGEVVTLPLPR